MYKMTKILCLIPARSGSKRIPDKNIKKMCGKPLIGLTIEQAKKSRYVNIMRIIVSTDSEKYRDTALSYGAEVPFIRPKNISLDTSTDYEFIFHALFWLKKNENYVPDMIVHLRPTQPCRTIKLIDDCIYYFLNNFNDYDSLRTVIPFYISPYKMYKIKDNLLKPLFNEVDGIKEPYNSPNQILPISYINNGYVDIIKTSIIKDNCISGTKIFPYIMKEEDSIDIDTMKDWHEAERRLNIKL